MKELLNALNKCTQQNVEQTLKDLGYDPETTIVFATCQSCGEQQAAACVDDMKFVCSRCGGKKFQFEFDEEERDEEDEEDEIIVARGRACFYLKAYQDKLDSMKKKRKKPPNGSSS